MADPRPELLAEAEDFTHPVPGHILSRPLCFIDVAHMAAVDHSTASFLTIEGICCIYTPERIPRRPRKSAPHAEFVAGIRFHSWTQRPRGFGFAFTTVGKRDDKRDPPGMDYRGKQGGRGNGLPRGGKTPGPRRRELGPTAGFNPFLFFFSLLCFLFQSSFILLSL